MIPKLKISDNLELSRLSLGFWRLLQWNYTENELIGFIEKLLEIGVTSFDHADIYGDYRCESVFGNVLAKNSHLRNQIQLVTKFGIKLVSKNRPENSFHCYDTTKDYIIAETEKSLKNLKTDYLDLLLIHRPDYLMDAEEVAEAFTLLKNNGKVNNFGVSNFTRSQFELLQSSLPFKLATDQIEINLFNFKHLENGDSEFLQMNKIIPMVWSPLAGGRIFTDKSEKGERIRYVLGEIREETGAEYDVIALAWLLKLPLNPIIVLGSGNLDRIRNAANAFNLELTNEQWYRLWTASKGHEVP